MPAQTQESKRAGMNAFLETFEVFEDVMEDRKWYYGKLFASEKIGLFGIYVGRME